MFSFFPNGSTTADSMLRRQAVQIKELQDAVLELAANTKLYAVRSNSLAPKHVSVARAVELLLAHNKVQLLTTPASEPNAELVPIKDSQAGTSN